ALSPCFWAGGKQLHNLLSKSELSTPTRVYMDFGSGEVRNNDRKELAEIFKGSAELTGAGADVTAQVVPGALHNEAAWEKRIPVFMNYLLG
ncbi:MAG: hypothetical protein IKP86_05965, partial [Anaerolineaceae bacterium]|nr:hypothetical protein [Anaerolineaceae bacterium]